MSYTCKTLILDPKKIQMLDFSYFNDGVNSTAIIQEFIGQVGNDAEYVYMLPRNKQFVYIFLIGPYRDWETDRKSTRLNSSH